MEQQTTATGSTFLLGKTCSNFTSQITDKGSHSDMDASFWVPDYHGANLPSDFYFVGNFASKKYTSPPPGSMMLYKASDEEGTPPCLQPPAGFTKLWERNDCPLKIFAIIAPFGYVSVGCIVTADGNPPSANNVTNFDHLMCVRADLCEIFKLSEDDQVWNDHGSHADTDVTVFQLPHSDVAWAENNYNLSPTTYDIVLQSDKIL